MSFAAGSYAQCSLFHALMTDNSQSVAGQNDREDMKENEDQKCVCVCAFVKMT